MQDKDKLNVIYFLKKKKKKERKNWSERLQIDFFCTVMIILC